jgi:hypothetical protein
LNLGFPAARDAFDNVGVWVRRHLESAGAFGSTPT